MTASNLQKQTILRSICRRAAAEGTTLLAALEGFSDERAAEAASPIVLTSASANGKSTSRTLAPGTSYADGAEIAADLINLYHCVRAAFASAGIDPTDEQVCEEMLARLPSVQAAIADFSFIADLRSAGEVVL